MKITLNENGNRTTVSVDGMLDTSSSAEFLQTVMNLIEGGKEDIMLDCTDMIYISSQGIRALLTLIKTSMAKNLHLAFHGIRPAVMEILDMSGISEAMVME